MWIFLITGYLIQSPLMQKGKSLYFSAKVKYILFKKNIAYGSS
jgi:hypothetical protein